MRIYMINDEFLPMKKYFKNFETGYFRGGRGCYTTNFLYGLIVHGECVHLYESNLVTIL